MNPIWHVAGVAENDYFMNPNLDTYTNSLVKPLMPR